MAIQDLADLGHHGRVFVAEQVAAEPFVRDSVDLTFYENGEIATVSNVFTFDNTNGIGTAQGYSIYTFEDGSTQVHKWQEKWQKSSTEEGRYTYVRGTSRFEGIKGSGSFSGKFFESIATGYSDFTGTYTLPKK